MPNRSLVIAVAFAALGLAACGDTTNSRVIARDQATTVSCDWYQMCNQIGAGLKFENRESCETQVRGQWDSGWPAAMCDSKINQNQLTICLNAIKGTLCTNPLDIINTLANKCPESSICSGP
jgi:putative hemolysin